MCCFVVQVFYWTHFCYLPFWLLCVLHAPNFWKWFIGPFCIFAMEKMISLYKSHSEEGKSYVTTGVVLPSRVIQVHGKSVHHLASQS